MAREQKHALGYKIMTKVTDPRHKRSPRKIKRKHLRIKWVYTDVWNRATKNLRLANASRDQEQVLSTPYPKPPETKTESSTAFTVPQPIIAATEKPPEFAGIIAGKPATFSDVPWQAGIRLISGTLDVHHCGGIIVSSLWILTAAHCFMDSQNVSSYRVRVGDVDNTVKELSEMEYAVEQIIVHPSFTSDVVFYDYDIALVKIVPINNLGIQFNDYVKSVLVPGTNTQIFPLTGCTISGWGRTTQVISDPGATVLQKANVDVFNTTGQAECNTAYANMITDRMLCAGPQDGSGVDACVGDSGGPLVCKIQGHDVVVGVTSWGTTVCGVAGFPGVYANIQYFLDWLYNPY